MWRKEGNKWDGLSKRFEVHCKEFMNNGTTILGKYAPTLFGILLLCALLLLVSLTAGSLRGMLFPMFSSLETVDQCNHNGACEGYLGEVYGNCSDCQWEAPSSRTPSRR
jgi:hypothetical protein